MLTGKNIPNTENNLRINQILLLQGQVPIPALPSRFNPTDESYFTKKKKKKISSINEGCSDNLDTLLNLKTGKQREQGICIYFR